MGASSRPTASQPRTAASLGQRAAGLRRDTSGVPLTAGLWILIAIGAQVGFLAGGIWGVVVTAALSLTVGSGALGWTLARRFAGVPLIWAWAG